MFLVIMTNYFHVKEQMVLHVHKTFEIEGNKFEIFDVGSQRSERRKWVNYFDVIDAVLFVVSLSCYDQFSFYDGYYNAMHESRDVFDETVNLRYFKHATMIIFFNKADLFRVKIEKRPLSICFPEYTYW